MNMINKIKRKKYVKEYWFWYKIAMFMWTISEEYMEEHNYKLAKKYFDLHISADIKSNIAFKQIKRLDLL